MATKEEVKRYKEYLKALREKDPDIIMAMEADEENVNWLQKVRAQGKPLDTESEEQESSDG